MRTSNSTPFKVEMVSGHAVTFKVSGSGRFEAYIPEADGTVPDDPDVTATTYDEALKKVETRLRGARVKMSIRFFDQTAMKHKTVTGKHAGTGNMLVET